MIRSSAKLAAAVLLIVFASACDEDEGGKGDVAATPATPVGGVRGAFAEPRVEEVVVYDDRLEPRQITVPAGVPVRVQVGNRSKTDCTFFVGDYLLDLKVPAGQTGAMAFTVPEVAQRGQDPSTTVTMGCKDDTRRQGTAVIEFTGLRPGSGR